MTLKDKRFSEQKQRRFDNQQPQYGRSIVATAMSQAVQTIQLTNDVRKHLQSFARESELDAGRIRHPLYEVAGFDEDPQTAEDAFNHILSRLRAHPI